MVSGGQGKRQLLEHALITCIHLPSFARYDVTTLPVKRHGGLYGTEVSVQSPFLPLRGNVRDVERPCNVNGTEFFHGPYCM